MPPAPPPPVKTPLPSGAIIAVLLVNAAEAVNINILFPFMAWMVEDLGYGGKRLGIYTGCLAASFCAAQFLTSVCWGQLSDKFGRKPTLVFGTLGTAFGTLVFGFSTSYTQAVLGRVMSGLLSGNLGILKSYLTEITDDTNRSDGFSILQIAGSIGNILGPLIGGMLSNPTRNFPRVFPPTCIFADFPYLLPCLLAVANNVLAALMCALCMSETRKWPSSSTKPSSTAVAASTMKEKVAQPLQVQNKGGESAAAQFVILGDEEAEDDDDDEMGDVRMVRSTHGLLRERADCSRTTKIKGDDEDRAEEEDGEEKEEEEEECTGSTDNETHSDTDTTHSPSRTSSSDDVEKGQQQDDHTPPPTSSSSSSASSSASSNASSSSSSSSSSSILSDRVVLLAVSNYGLLAFSYIILDETLPLYMKSQVAEGGFGFASHEIGALLSLSGGVMLIFNTILLPIIAKQSKLWLFKVTNLFAIPLVMLWPSVGAFNKLLVDKYGYAQNSRTLWICLLTTSTIKNVLATLTFTAIIITINHSVMDESLGKVNGVGQSMASLARAIGPALGGVLWSLSVHVNCSYINFVCVAVLLVICQFINYQLPISLDVKKNSLCHTQ